MDIEKKNDNDTEVILFSEFCKRVIMILFFNHNDGIDSIMQILVYPVIGFKSLSAEIQNIGMLGETTRHLNDRISGCSGRLLDT